MRKFFANMTIRASLLWVLAFFSFMLVIGAALGVLPAHQQRYAGRTEAIAGTGRCARLVLSYKDALNGLSRAASSNYADIVRNVGQRPCRRRAWLAKPPACCSGRRPPEQGPGRVRVLQEPGSQARRRGRIAQEIEESYSILIQQGLNPLAATLERATCPATRRRCRWCRTRWKAFARAIEGFDFWRAPARRWMPSRSPRCATSSC